MMRFPQMMTWADRLMLFLAVSLVTGALCSEPTVYAADWEMRLSASMPYTSAEGGRATQSVTVGAGKAAKDAFDNASDTKAINGFVMTAFVYHPEFAPNDQFLARDIRANHYPQTWMIDIASNQDGQPVTLSWTLPPGRPGGCQDVTLSLTDASTGVTVDLLGPSYQYSNVAATPRRFTLTASQATQNIPGPPMNLRIPRQHIRSTAPSLIWNRVNDPSVVGYQLYRKDPGATGYVRRTVSPLTSPKYLDSDQAPGGYSYYVTAVTSAGCESSPSNTIDVTVGANRHHPRH
jgi:hypothetical protein